MKLWIIGGLLIVLGFGLAFGGSIWYTRSQVQHECQALEFIQHSQLQNQDFAHAVNFWAHEDGCD